MDWQKNSATNALCIQINTSAGFISQYKINWTVAESNLLPQEMSVNQIATCFLPKKNI